MRGDSVQHLVQKLPDTATGLTLTVASAVGLSLQTATDWLGFATLTVNLLLGVGGLVLLGLKLHDRFKRRK